MIAARHAQIVDQVAQFRQKEVHRPEIRALVGQMGRPPVANLVVKHHRPSGLRNVAESLHIVMGAARPAMQHDQRRLAGAEIAGHPIPGAVFAEPGISPTRVHRIPLLSEANGKIEGWQAARARRLLLAGERPAPANYATGRFACNCRIRIAGRPRPAPGCWPSRCRVEVCCFLGPAPASIEPPPVGRPPRSRSRGRHRPSRRAKTSPRRS